MIIIYSITNLPCNCHFTN
ncbi:hypothetical protein F383_28813 [Gossypium arboreum]|uniref:Uncharacterized protein n=1 Tax=Gossypium arboreum TaxID=29729 RepID=A0A0B0MWJ9_GOSAR|nr:hypothetical protein F383_30290 [Gossypium arboreum]KHG04737.1 hypothetical protein F383_28813 [Gossypium arboreum]